jgi:SPP1 family predicted phage head-tail adaptor
MLAGKLDRRVVLQRASFVRDATGQPIASWSTIATVWASWRRASARETLAAAEVAATVTDVFEIRWSSDVADLNPKDRLSYDARTYDIAAVDEIDRRVGLRITAAARRD